VPCNAGHVTLPRWRRIALETWIILCESKVNLGLEDALRRASWLAIAALVLSVVGVMPNVCLAGPGDAAAAAETIAASSISETPTEAALPSAAPEPAANPPAGLSKSSSVRIRPWPAGSCCLLQLGLGIDVSSLGFGGQLAVQVLQRANVRVGFNAFDYHGTLTNGGIFYTGKLNLQSVNANFDYFLFRSFHVSPGLLIDDRNHASDSALVPGGQRFLVGNTTYESSAFSPVTASAQLNLRKLAPELLFGIGNLIPRGRRRWSIEFEAGAAYQGSPAVTLNLTGFACVPPSNVGPSCNNAATDPSVQSNVRVQEAKLSRDAAIFRFYPVVLIGIGYSF
jgi:hypothetical protein